MSANYRSDCPHCGGRNTFSVSTIDGVEKAQCFKAGCTHKYIKDTDRTCDDLSGWGNSIPRRTLGDYHFVSILSNEQAYRLVGDYGIPHLASQIVYDPARNRVVFIYKDQAVGRSLDGSNPKWYRYTDSVEPIIFETTHYISEANQLIVVEDSISAAVVGRHVNCMALLGTDFQDSYYKYLSEYKEVFIALDKDATNKAIDIARDLCYIRPTKVTIISKDLKEHSSEELYDYFNEWGIEYE